MQNDLNFQWFSSLNIADLHNRLWQHVDKTETCWIWRNSSNNAYHAALYRHCQILAHRLVWMLVNGEIPSGKLVCHTCDVRACVRPSHLFLGTYSDNARDAGAKGHLKGGSSSVKGARKSNNTTLNKLQVKEIRATYNGKRGEQAELAKRFNVSQATICRVIKKQHWKWVDDEL